MDISLFHRTLRLTLFLTVAAYAALVQAENVTKTQSADTIQNPVAIQNAWVRPTNKGQDVGAAYMTFTSKQDATLVHVESDVTKAVEIHSMTMQNGVMKMRMLEALPLTAGQPYKLAPGGFHLMLFDLKQPLTEGEHVNFELTFKNKNGVEFKQQVRAMVKTAGDEAGDSGNAHEHHHHEH